MRSATPRACVAGKSATGTDTSPKVIVPDQKVRSPATASVSSATGRLLQAAQARLERVSERLLVRLLRPELGHLRLAAVRLRLDQLEHARAIVVVQRGRIEALLERGDE